MMLEARRQQVAPRQLPHSALVGRRWAGRRQVGGGGGKSPLPPICPNDGTSGSGDTRSPARACRQCQQLLPAGRSPWALQVSHCSFDRNRPRSTHASAAPSSLQQPCPVRGAHIPCLQSCRPASQSLQLHPTSSLWVAAGAGSSGTALGGPCWRRPRRYRRPATPLLHLRHLLLEADNTPPLCWPSPIPPPWTRRPTERAAQAVRAPGPVRAKQPADCHPYGIAPRQPQSPPLPVLGAGT